MRLAYADPPYLGCCRLYGHRHEAPYGCWDEPVTQIQLMNRLDHNYDGWAMSLSSPSLIRLGPAAPAGVRIAAWVKPFAAFKANVRIAYTWEPVIYKPGRDSSKDGAPVGRDHLSCPITMKRGFTGAKPQKFAAWVLDLMGYIPSEDEFTDVFPGTGIVGQVASSILF